MIETNISEKDILILKDLQYQYPHHVVRQRALILLLKHQKIPHHKIAAIAGTCENTVRKCFSGYLQGGIEFVTTINFYKPQSKLKSFDAIIKEHFGHNPPTSIASLC